jgi:hypothetical protein
MITKRVGRINEGIRGPKHLLDTDTSIQLFFYHCIHKQEVRAVASVRYYVVEE